MTNVPLVCCVCRRKFMGSPYGHGNAKRVPEHTTCGYKCSGRLTQIKRRQKMADYLNVCLRG